MNTWGEVPNLPTQKEIDNMREARYVTSAVDLKTCPRDGLSEIVFMGRSNVGKSSLLNCILGRKKLAKTSSSPGVTRKMNYFLIDEKFYFVDLPGYGYAKVSKQQRQEWIAMIGEYLSLRETLKGAILIIDIRRDPDERDTQLAHDLLANDIPVLVAATKSDKFARSKAMAALQKLEKIYNPIGVEKLVMFSAVTGVGVKQIWQWIEEKLD